MKLTERAWGMLVRRYTAILKKCHLMNFFGGAVLAAAITMCGAGIANAAEEISGTVPPDITSGDAPVYTVVSGAEATLNGGRINGVQLNMDTGWGIVTNKGKLTIEGTTFDNNKVGDSVVYNLLPKTSELIINNATFSNNQATGSPAAVANMGVANITGTTFTNNTTTQSDHPTAGSSSAGGAALVLGSNSNTTITGGKFELNISDKNGGAIGTRSATAGRVDLGQLSINNVTFDKNEARNWGGAIYNTFVGVQVKDSTFTDNTADVYGGAIFNHGNVGNKGSEKAGEMIIENGSFSGNTAQQGGAIYSSTGSALTISGANTLFENNNAQGDTANLSSGGAIFAVTNLSIADAKFKNNSANQGGALNLYGDTSDGAAPMTINKATFEGNTATSFGGAIYHVYGTMEINDSTFQENKVTGLNGTPGGGGALAVQVTNGTPAGPSDITINNSTFTANEAGDGGALGVYDKVAVNGGTFSQNKATDANGGNGGGAIFVGSAANLSVSGGAQFSDNTSATVGGAIATRYSKTNAPEGAESGGTDQGIVAINGATFSGNSADKNGGAIYNTFAQMILEGENIFTDNTAGGNPNDIYNDATGTITVKSGATTLNGGYASAAGSKLVVDEGAVMNFGASSQNTFAGQAMINGTANFDGELTAPIDTAAADGKIVLGANGAVYANVINQDLAVTQGTVGLLGQSGSALGAAVTVNGGTFAFGNPDKGTVSGGSINGDVTVSGGASTVNGGQWTLESGKTLSVASGTLEIKNGATLDVTNGTFQNSANTVTVAGTLKGTVDQMFVLGADRIAENADKVLKDGVSQLTLDNGQVVLNGQVYYIQALDIDNPAQSIYGGLDELTALLAGTGASTQIGANTTPNSVVFVDAAVAENPTVSGETAEEKGMLIETGNISYTADGDSVSVATAGNVGAQKVEITGLPENGTVIVGNGSADNTNGRFVLLGTAEGGNLITGADGADIKVGAIQVTENSTLQLGEYRVENANENSGVLNAPVTLDNNASLIAQAGAYQVDEISASAEGQGTVAVQAGGTLTANNISAGTIIVGNNTVGAESDSELANQAGSTLFVTGNLNLGGGALIVDPSWDVAPSQAAIQNMGDAASTDMVTNGNVGVGQNSKLVLGDQNFTWLDGALGNENLSQPLGLKQGSINSILALNKPVKLGAGNHILVSGQANITPESLQNEAANFHQEGDTLLVVNGNSGIAYDTSGTAEGVAGAISGEAGSTANIESGAKLYITDAETGKTYVVLGEGFAPESITYGEEAWENDNLITDNPMVSLKRLDGDKTGQIGASTISAGILMPRLDSELVTAIDNAAEAGQIGTSAKFTDAGPRGTQFLSRVLSPNYLDAANNRDLAEVTVESAARMITIGAVPQMAMAANNAAGNAVTQRTSMADPKGQLMEQKVNGSSLGLWIMPLYQSTNGFGMEAGNFDYDFSGGLGGVTLGADYTFENAIRAGILFNIGGGYARGSGDLASTDNDMNFWGIGAYAGWNKYNVGLTADINYTSTFNYLKQDLPASMGWNELKSDVWASALSIGLRGEYKFMTEALDILPHVGVRYYYIHVDSYDIQNSGTVIDGDSMNQNIWTFPLGVTLAKELEMNNGWSFKPFVDFNVIPATGDIKAKSKIRFTGTDTQAELDTKMMDYFTYGGTVGVEFGNENIFLGVNYNAQFGAESSAQGVFGTFRYEF